MSEQKKLTIEGMLEKHRAYHLISGAAAIRIMSAMEEYASQEKKDVVSQRDKALDERDNATTLIKELLLFAEDSGEVVNGFRVTDVINKMKTLIKSLK